MKPKIWASFSNIWVRCSGLSDHFTLVFVPTFVQQVFTRFVFSDLLCRPKFDTTRHFFAKKIYGQSFRHFKIEPNMARLLHRS